MTSILDSLYKRNDIEAEFDPFFEVIEEVATGKEGRYSNCSFEELMKLEWFSKVVNTEFLQSTKPLTGKEEDVFSAKNHLSTMLCTYFKRFPNCQLLEDIAMHRIFHQKDINLGAIMAKRMLERKDYRMAFKICATVYRKLEESPYNWMAAESVCQMLGRMYEYGMGAEKDLQKAICYYKQCYEAFRSDCGYYLGRCYEKLGDDAMAMKYYKEIIDDGNYRETSVYRHHWDSENKRYKFNSIPYRLEISFRRMKKKMHPNRHDVLEITGSSRLKIFTMELHVLMNATITIDWGDGKKQTEKWKVNGWHFVGHEYSDYNENWNTKITSDEENVIMGFRPLTAYSVKSINFDRCKGLMYLICPNQSLKHLDLRGLSYLRDVNVHGNVLCLFSVNRLHNLTALDISNNPMKFLNLADSKVPLRLLSIRGTPLCYTYKWDIQKQMELDFGQIIGPFYLKEQHDLYPTVGYYMRNSKWKHIRNYILNAYPHVSTEYLESARQTYELLLKEKPQPSPEGIFLEADGTFVYPCRGRKDERGVYSEGYTDGESFYLTIDNPWSVVLGTPIRDADNRMPFMRLPQRRNAFFAAMCLMEMIENEKEMKAHGLEPIKYSWLGEE